MRGCLRVGPEIREEVPPVPGEVPVDRGVVMTTLLFTEDLHRQHLDVGQLWTALPQPTAERHRPVAIIDEQIQQDQRFFQAASPRLHGQIYAVPHPHQKPENWVESGMRHRRDRDHLLSPERQSPCAWTRRHRCTFESVAG